MVDNNITVIGRKAPKGAKTVYTRYDADFFTGRWLDLFEEEGDMCAEVFEDPTIPAKTNVYKQMEEFYAAIKVARPTVEKLGSTWFKRLIYRAKFYSLHPQMIKKILTENGINIPAKTKAVKLLVKKLHATAEYKAIVGLMQGMVAPLIKTADKTQELVEAVKSVDKEFFPKPRK